MNLEKLQQDLIRHEGLKLKPYHCTSGKLTIGVGRNIEDRGISKEEALHLLGNDIDISILELRSVYPWFEDMPDLWQNALIDMHVNMGLTRLGKFKKMLAALQSGDGEKAAVEALDSKWAREDVSEERSSDIATAYRS